MKRVLIVVAICLAVASLSFMSGRYAGSIHTKTAVCSLQVNQFRVPLERLRRGEEDKAVSGLEETLDFHVFILDQQMQEPAIWRTLFVPKDIRDQAESSLSLFVDYRKNLGADYTGMHISEIPTNATPEESFHIRQASQNKNIVNKRIKELVEEN